MDNAEPTVETRNEYAGLWNAVLVPRFSRWKHILVDGLTLHSADIFPSLDMHEGGNVFAAHT